MIEIGDRARLYLGDCRDVLATLEPDSIDACLCDPPYGIGYDASNSKHVSEKPFAPIAGDFETFNPSHLLGFPDVMLWGANNFAHGLPERVGQFHFWDKVTSNEADMRISEAEFVWHKKATRTRGFRHLWSGAYRASEAGQERLHPNQKPVALMRWCLNLMKLKEGATVIDPYMGSGPVGVACMELGFRYIGIELNPDYFAIAERRIRHAASQKRMF